ncbi:hypothetical protein [Alkaliphilus metalliredigens]|uniref:hypothetical protein n=1 Tax=Alkaliphilus metalliredigens TaxID=208226 RepID=UPI0002EE1241|nr:hypothetical protein [Alkaliphilus metalliredigens]
MSIRKSQWTLVNGHRVEEASKTYKFEERHFHRESKSQKAQLESAHSHGGRKDVKSPLDRRLT